MGRPGTWGARGLWEAGGCGRTAGAGQLPHKRGGRKEGEGDPRDGAHRPAGGEEWAPRAAGRWAPSLQLVPSFPVAQPFPGVGRPDLGGFIGPGWIHRASRVSSSSVPTPKSAAARGPLLAVTLSVPFLAPFFIRRVCVRVCCCLVLFDCTIWTLDALTVTFFFVLFQQCPILA